jgi:membrane protein implicated in regulation of membrane protease activity
MTFSLAVAWWVLAGALVAIELLTGTFYLLAMALGAAAAAVAAHLDASLTAQLVAAALVGGGSIALLHVKRARHPRSAPSQANRDVLLDIGQDVEVPAWDDEGTAQVQYRGAQWRARSADPATRSAGRHVIVAIQGNELQLAPATDRH